MLSFTTTFRIILIFVLMCLGKQGYGDCGSGTCGLGSSSTSFDRPNIIKMGIKWNLVPALLEAREQEREHEKNAKNKKRQQDQLKAQLEKSEDPNEKAKINNQIEELGREIKDEEDKAKNAENQADTLLKNILENQKAAEACKSGGGGSGKGGTPMMMPPQQQQQPQQNNKSNQQPIQQPQVPQEPNITTPQQTANNNNSDNDQILDLAQITKQMQSGNNTTSAIEPTTGGAVEKLIGTIKADRDASLGLVKNLTTGSNGASSNSSGSPNGSPNASQSALNQPPTVAEKFGNSNNQNPLAQMMASTPRSNVASHAISPGSRSSTNSSNFVTNNTTQRAGLRKAQRKLISSLKQGGDSETTSQSAEKVSNASDILAKLLGKEPVVQAASLSQITTITLYKVRNFMPSQALIVFIRENQKLIGGSSKNFRNKIKTEMVLVKNKTSKNPSLRPHNVLLLKRTPLNMTHILSE